MEISPEFKHALPLPFLESRHVSAKIFGMLDTKKKSISILLLLSKSSRAFVITQKGLPGFLIDIEFEKKLKLFKESPALLSLKVRDELAKEIKARYKLLVSLNRIEEADETQKLLKKSKASEIAFLHSLDKLKEI